jgi:hypothetical protein
VAIAAFLVAFVLPFWFPPRHPSYSRAYTAGANNQVAMVGLGSLSVLVAAVCWWWRVDPFPSTQAEARAGSRPLRWAHLGWGIAAIVAFTLALGIPVARNGFFYSDAGYFLTQMRTGLVFHGQIFRDFEFPYGILLYEWPATFLRLLGKFGIPAFPAYIAALAAAEAAGVALLFYIVRRLPMRHSLRVLAFGLIVFGSMDPLLGINYSLLRFVLPVAGAVLLGTQESLAAACGVAFGGVVLLWFTSPELGLAFTGAALADGLYRGLKTGARWLGVSLAAALALGFYAAVTLHDSLSTLGKFAGGEFNLILQPVVHVFCLLAATVVFAPLAVVWALDRDQRAARVLLPMFVVALGLLPSALGRCDPLHAFFNGICAYLLTLVAIDKAAPRWRTIGVGLVAFLILYTQVQDFYFYRYLLEDTARGKLADDDLSPAKLAALRQAVGPNRVLFPWNMPLRLTGALTASGQFQPEYFCVMPLDQESEERKVQEMRAASFLMVPGDLKLVTTDDIDNGGFKRWMRLGYVYPVRQGPFYSGALMLAELAQHWRPVGSFGPYTLYRKAAAAP